MSKAQSPHTPNRLHTLLLPSWPYGVLCLEDLILLALTPSCCTLIFSHPPLRHEATDKLLPTPNHLDFRAVLSPDTPRLSAQVSHPQPRKHGSALARMGGLTLHDTMNMVKMKMRLALDTGSQRVCWRVKRMAPYRLALVGLDGVALVIRRV